MPTSMAEATAPLRLELEYASALHHDKEYDQRLIFVVIAL
jgi:hypothetical protein